MQFHVIADTSRSMGYRGERAWCSKLDYAKIVAASLCWLLLKQKDATGLLIQEADAAKTPRAGEAAFAPREPQMHFPQAVAEAEPVWAYSWAT